jgi:hypothetical protein
LDGAADRLAMFAGVDVFGELGFVAEALAGGDEFADASW